MVVVRGVNVYQAAVDEIVRQHVTWAEYQVELSGSGRCGNQFAN